MKIVIETNELEDKELTPYSVYRCLYLEYEKVLRSKCGYLWGMVNACDCVARELYSQKTGRKSNVKNLILTYSDAQKCFELFKQFADVWAENI